MSDLVSTPTEKARIGAPSIEGFTQEGEKLVETFVDQEHNHSLPQDQSATPQPGKRPVTTSQVMGSRAERLTSFDVADFPMPTGREEEWRFTPLARFSNLLSDDAGAPDNLEVKVSAPEGVLQAPLAPGESVRGSVLVPADRAAAVASANAPEAIHLTIGENAELDEPVVVTLTGKQAGVRSNSHVVLEAGANSRAVVVLEHHGSADFNGNVEVVVGEGSKLTLVSLQLWNDDATHAGQQDAQVGVDAHYRHVVVTLGGGAVRLNANARFGGPGANAELMGLYFADAGQHLEHRTYVDHNQPRCVSDVLYKGALQGKGAHTVWIGDVLIQKQAEGTDSYEKNQNLVLTKGARADSVPNLEIETGLIEGAGHASSTGRFDDEHLFYLMARGIPEPVARRLVVRGFLNEIIQKIKVPEIESRLAAEVERELQEGNN